MNTTNVARPVTVIRPAAPFARPVPTPAQWQAAWQRAVANALDLFATADPHTWVVTSASDPGLAHLVTDHRDLPGGPAFRCDCKGFAGHRVCQHVAVVAAAVDALGPEPAA